MRFVTITLNFVNSDLRVVLSQIHQIYVRNRVNANINRIDAMKDKTWKLEVMPAMEVTSKSFEEEFYTYQEALAASNFASGLLLFMQDEEKIMNDYSNLFVLSNFIDGEWVDIEDML